MQVAIQRSGEVVLERAGDNERGAIHEHREAQRVLSLFVEHHARERATPREGAGFGDEVGA